MNGWDMGQQNNPIFDTMNQRRMVYQNGFGFAPAPRYELIKVNGEAGARNFKMAPNSSALLLDETAPIVWLVQTDGSGLLTPTPFDITIHQQTPPIDINNLAERVAQLEELINAKSNTNNGKQSKKQRQHNESASDSAD